MPKVKAIFKVFLNSLVPNHFFYREIPSNGIKQSLSYFIILNIFTYTVLFIFLGANLIGNTDFFNLKRNITQSMDTFPHDLVINIKDGKAQSNYSRPYFMWTKYKDSQQLLLAVDTMATIENIKGYNAWFGISSNYLILKTPLSQKYTITSLNSYNIKINKPTVNEYEKKFIQIYEQVKILAIVGSLFLIPVLLIGSNALFILIASLCIYSILNKLQHKPAKFRNIFTIGLYSVTLPMILLSFLLILVGLNIKTLPFIYLLSIVICLFISTQEVYNNASNN